ncbi:MAG: VCBS repeat-containing protein [Candidatus Giovannonibacteria bacterium GW2011_GWA2_44_13b]|nr:MAG: VCBS repeat-containing protein [Candidatus Giovannonibacteria bacterium GW2011_GWA2_44_13b]
MSVLKSANASLTIVAMVVYLMAPIVAVLPRVASAAAVLTITCGSVSISGSTWTMSGTWKAIDIAGQPPTQYDGAVFSPSGTLKDDSSKDIPDTFVITESGHDFEGETNKNDAKGTWSNEVSFTSTPTGVFATLYHAEVPGAETSGDATCTFTLPPQCFDGLDNDLDGATDYPSDLGCSSLTDDTESPNPPTPNSDPVLDPIGNQSGDEGSVISFDANASDVDAGDTLSFAISGDVPAGSTFNAVTGEFSWTPGEADGGSSHTVTVTVDDSNGGTDFETFQVSAIETNTAPVATTPIVVDMDEDSSIDLDLLASDSDNPLQTLVWSIVSGPLHGVLSFISNNDYTYAPSLNFVGSDSFTWKAFDGFLDSNIGTVSITVHAVNDAPVLTDIGNKSVDELVNLTFTASATDVDTGDILFFSLSGEPGGATINSSTGVFSWTPTEAQGPGDYTFNVVVADNHGGTDFESITVHVNEVNVAPVASDVSVATHMNTPKLITMVTSDVDVPIELLAMSLVSSPANGTLGSISGNDVTYTPADGFVGSDSFTYKATDEHGADSNTATVNITVNNDAPSISGIPNTEVIETELLSMSLTGFASDPDDDVLIFSLSGEPSGASITSGGDFSWTPTEAQGPGTYTVIVVVTDGQSSDSTSFDVEVTEENLAPSADDKDIETDEDTSVGITMTGSDGDIPVQTLTFSVADGPANGTLVVTGDVASYTPGENFNGSDSFTYIANDGVADSDPATVNFTVNSVNDDPVIILIGDSEVTVAVGSDYTDDGYETPVSDPDGDEVDVTEDSDLDTDTEGDYEITYTADDGNGGTDSVTRTVHVVTDFCSNIEDIQTEVPEGKAQAGSACYDDVDGDGVPHEEEVYDGEDADNCPVTSNSDQADADADGLGDVCDASPTPTPEPTVTPTPEPTATPTPEPTSTGGGGGGGGNGSPGISGFAPTIPSQGGQVLGAEAINTELCSDILLNNYLKMGKQNNVDEVKKLQTFLNEYIVANLPVTGFFGNMTHAAVKSFQVREANNVLNPWIAATGSVDPQGTGYVYKTTKRWINMLHCQALQIEMPQLP